MSGRLYLDEIYSKNGQTKVLDTTSFDANNNFEASNTGFNLNYQSANAALNVVQSGTGDALRVNSNALVVNSAGNVGIGTSSPSYNIDVKGSTGISAQRATDTDSLIMQWDGFTSYGNSVGAYNNIKFISQNNSGSVERMRIDSSGNVVWGNNGLVPADSASVNAKVVHASDGYVLRSHRSITTTTNHMYFFNPNGLCGKIETSGTSTTYVTLSDYRLKENITDITDGISRVKQLNPSRFNFISDPDIIVDGFIAHEVSDVVPEAISGEKDAVNGDGSINPQGIDQSKLVPLLTAALQESIELIESQQSQIDTLTAKTQEQDFTIASLISRIEAIETQPT